MISIRNVNHHLAGRQILNEINLDIARGGITALIGPNGAGKSTLLALMARLQKLQSGKITIDGQQIGATSDKTLARKLAIMAQSDHIAARLRIGELVGFGRYPWHSGRASDADQLITKDALRRFGLEDIAERFVDEVSGGQRQRARAAMAWAQGTDYLLLDEPLNNLDIAAARQLMGLLRIMAAQDGKTIVIVLHDINYAAAFADHIIAMKGGRIAIEGKPRTVVNAQMLRDVFETQAEVYVRKGRPVVLV
ncbi:MAG: ABC transporter ATP-binding protein [Paracoccaceae bacterium]